MWISTSRSCTIPACSSNKLMTSKNRTTSAEEMHTAKL
ncbi:hypothetical protein CLSA_c30940 [Clostridium saccharobutylicum DSM 13864]|uniref:Uncharacterized protein n=1 Tax=Clostridium saccharobutylicum DSM 13864 TaxID=1345695 RepID=U5MTZ0_CLOSA|nr:hypothetical protein CLSA_c30940 [Clostridium saccharobutylicum DSM 13864]